MYGYVCIVATQKIVVFFFFLGGVEILGISFFYKNEHGFMSLNKKIICCQTNTPNVVNQGKNLSLF